MGLERQEMIRWGQAVNLAVSTIWRMKLLTEDGVNKEYVQKVALDYYDLLNEGEEYLVNQKEQERILEEKERGEQEEYIAQERAKKILEE